jgi:4-carboxymuconolactone decarboxylase
LSDQLFETGIAVRREVAGANYVDDAFQNANDFTMPMQQLVTEWCWGAVWARPGLDRRTRSMLTIVMLASLNRLDELQGHIRGAITNGVTKEEIQECLLQVAVYAGVPAGMSGFKVARRVLDELEV